jgi:hypothetical protein
MLLIAWLALLTWIGFAILGFITYGMAGVIAAFGGIGVAWFLTELVIPILRATYEALTGRDE